MEFNLRSFLHRFGASVYPPSTLSCWLLPANYVGFLCAIGRRYHAPSHLSSLSRALSARHLTTFAVAFRFFFPGKRHKNLIWFSTYNPVLHIIFTGLPAREREKVGGRRRRKRESDGRYAAWNLSTHNAQIRVIHVCNASTGSRPRFEVIFIFNGWINGAGLRVTWPESLLCKSLWDF